MFNVSNMELKIDLLEKKRKKSLFRVLLGIGFALIASLWIIIRFVEEKNITLFDWFYFGIFTLNGVVHFVEGLGYSSESFFGKAYILINSELISLKASVYDKNQLIKWSDIKTIDYKFNKYEIKKTDNTCMIINLSKFDYMSIQEIKKAIDCIAKEKTYN